MIDFFWEVDRAAFSFINGTLANPVFDVLMPFLTDLNKTLVGRIAALALWLALVWKGGRKGRLVAFMVIPLIAFTDQLNSSVVKNIVMRPRPCHEFDGVPVLANVRLLVDCGSGFSFPSSHAVNNFAAAPYFSFFYRKWTWAIFALASLVVISRVYVGVHYPSDILGGAIVGSACCVGLIALWKKAAEKYPALKMPEFSDSELKNPT